MYQVDKNSIFWKYLSGGQKGLIEEGLYLFNDLKQHPDINITDYSYLVFPFGKAYEGFLKQLFLDLGFISEHDYISDHFRIGKALNPHMQKRLHETSIYFKIAHFCNRAELANKLWNVWKRGRNLVFHYFPHNLNALTFSEAETIVSEMLQVMEEAIVCLPPSQLRG